MNKAQVIKSLEGRVSKTTGDFITRAVMVSETFDDILRNVADEIPEEGDYIFDECLMFVNSWKKAEKEGRILRPINLGSTIRDLVPEMSKEEVREYLVGNRKIDDRFSEAFKRIISAYTHISPFTMFTGDPDGELDERIHFENGALRVQEDLVKEILREF